MKKLFYLLSIFVLFTIGSYANNIHLKNLQHGCNYFRKAAIDEPSVLWIFNFMEHYKNLSLDNISEVIDGVLYVEEWRGVVGYEEFYQVSSFGRIKRLQRKLLGNGRNQPYRLFKEKVLKQTFVTKGYLSFNIKISPVSRIVKIHRVVLESFKGTSYLGIDHINGIKTDNRLLNLEYVTNRENTVRYHKSKKLKYPTGVRPDGNGFSALIKINGKKKYLGYFNDINKAAEAYEKAKKEIENDFTDISY